MRSFAVDYRNKVKRSPNRAVYDKELVYHIIDKALICNVGFVHDGHPFVIPTIHVRSGESIYIHGSKKSRMINQICTGNSVCVTFTILDGLVLARSIFHHTMNYRSVIIYGKGKVVNEKDKVNILKLMSEKLIPGRWNEARKPINNELRATSIVSIKIESASAKIRSGPPVDEKDDYSLETWAGVIPITQVYREQISDSKLSEHIRIPSCVEKLIANNKI
ncbi:pyridoxamine 5'-phosphate oxidase family protein [Bacteroidota bacterium]